MPGEGGFLKQERSPSADVDRPSNFLSQEIEFRSLPGLVDFAAGEALQRELVEQRIRDEIPDTVLFLEHAPVVTRGRGLQRGSLASGVAPIPASPPDVSGVQRQMPLGALPPGTTYAECSRGGDLTWHGPGQLVVYPIFKIRDLGAYLRDLERIAITVIQGLAPELRAFSRENSAGVWVEKRSGGSTLSPGARMAPTMQPSEIDDTKVAPLKIASLGIAVRKWVTYHGLALNCVNDRAGFDLISPCGYAPEVMTRLADHVALGPDSGDWRKRVETEFTRSFQGAI
jgi:lipoate-protein ligase B